MKNVLKVIVNVLSWIVLVLALLVTILVFSSQKNNGVANLFGVMPFTVESDSMKPTFSQGDLIFCREVDDMNSLAEGDVITFWTIIDGKREKNTHRIVRIEDENGSRSYITRGDNNAIDDEIPVYAADIIGRWTKTKLPGMGKAMSFLRTKTGFFVCIIIPMAIFFLFELYKFIATLIEVKRPASATAEIDEEEIKRRAVEEYLAAQKLAAEKEAAENAAKSEAPAAEPETKPESAEAKPETPAAETETKPESVEVKPETPAAEPETKPESAEAKPETPAAETETKPESAEAKSETPAAETEIKPESVEVKPESDGSAEAADDTDKKEENSES